MMQQPNPLDLALAEVNRALFTLFAAPEPVRSSPAQGLQEGSLSAAERARAAQLMRINHVGEVCAQALYRAQSISTNSPHLRAELAAAAREETDHLAWCAERLRELDSRPSLLNGLWYAGAFSFGWIAGRIGDQASLSFVVETERQVEAHLANHLERLPAADLRSRAIVSAMREDEAQHAEHAQTLGGTRPGPVVSGLMKAAADVMKTIAARI